MAALRQSRLICPECEFCATARYDPRPVASTWRHLDLGAWRLAPGGQSGASPSAALRMRYAGKRCPSPGPVRTSPGTSRTWSAGWPPPWTRRRCADWCASTGTPSGAPSPGLRSAGRVKLSDCVRPMAVPHRRQACQTQRRTAAGCTPSARATSPTGWPAPTSPTAWTRTAGEELDHDPPRSRPLGPPDQPGPFGSGIGPPLRPPRPRLRAGTRWPSRARRGWPRTGWHRRGLPDGPAGGVGGRGPGRGRGGGRVAGKPRQHRSDRLGLLLRKAAASLASEHLHLVREP